MPSKDQTAISPLLPAQAAKDWTADWELSGDSTLDDSAIVTDGKSGMSLAKYKKPLNLKNGGIYRLQWEYTLKREAGWGSEGGNQALEILNGPLHLKIWGAWPYLNHNTLARNNQQLDVRYKMSVDFSNFFIFSWKIDDIEQLNAPLPAMEQQTPGMTAVLQIGDGPKGQGRTVWHRVMLEELPHVPPSKLDLLCFPINKKKEQAAFNIGINASTDKVPLAQNHYTGRIADTVRLSIPRGGIRSFQLTVLPLQKELRKVRIRHPKTFSGIELDSYLLGYVRVNNPSMNNSSYGHYWPDALLEVQERNIAADLAQPYWFDVSVPPKAGAGEHETIITVSSQDGGTRQIHLIVEVKDFVLPMRNSISTALALNPGVLERCYHPDESRELYGKTEKSVDDALYNLIGGKPLEGSAFWRKIYKKLLNYRINPASLYSDGFTGNGEFRVVPAMEDVVYAYEAGMNSICLGCTRTLPGDEKEKTVYFEKIRKHLKKWEIFAQEHPFKNFTWYWHAFDESELKAKKYPLQKERMDREITEVARLIKGEFPWVKIETANEYVPRHREHFDIWTPRPFDLVQQAKNKSQFWVYVACGPNKPYANFFIDNPGTDPRTFGWQIFLSRPKISGFLYYQLYKEIPREDWQNSTLPFPYVPVNTLVLEVSGDGILSYPGKDKELFLSTRLANFRDGLQDLAALEMLDAESRKLPEDHALRKKAEEIFKQASLLVQDWTTYSDDGFRYDRLRDTIDSLLTAIINQKK